MNAPISAFDPTAFLDATTTQASEKRPPLPIDKTYTAIIKELKPRAWQGKSDPTKSGMAFDVTFTVEVPQDLQDALKLGPEIPMFDSMMLDLTEQGAIDWAPGKNRRLRMYREATGQNVAGQPFAPRMLQGQVVTLVLEHEIYENEPRERVKTVIKKG